MSEELISLFTHRGQHERNRITQTPSMDQALRLVVAMVISGQHLSMADQAWYTDEPTYPYLYAGRNPYHVIATLYLLFHENGDAFTEEEYREPRERLAFMLAGRIQLGP